MKFRGVCIIAASLALLMALALYLLPWLLTLPAVTRAVPVDAWHQGHGVFARSVALVLLFVALLIWGVRGLAGQALQMGVSASLSIACLLCVAGLAYFTLTGSVAAQVESLGEQSDVSRVAENVRAAQSNGRALQAQTGPSSAKLAAASISDSLVWSFAGFFGLLAVLFGVSILPDEKRRSRRR